MVHNNIYQGHDYDIYSVVSPDNPEKVWIFVNVTFQNIPSGFAKKVEISINDNLQEESNNLFKEVLDDIYQASLHSKSVYNKDLRNQIPEWDLNKEKWFVLNKENQRIYG